MKKTPLPFNINDVADAETIDSNNDTNINDISSSKSAQIAAKKIVTKYKNLRRKGKLTLILIQYYPEDIDPTKNPKVSNPNVRNKNVQIAAKKIVQKYKKISQKKPPLPFDISDVADDETVSYNNEINIRDVSSNKSAQTAAMKIVQKYKKLAKKKAPISDVADAEQ